MAQNTFSKKYSYLAINKDEDKILTDIFTKEEESSDDDLESVSSDDDDDE